MKQYWRQQGFPKMGTRPAVLRLGEFLKSEKHTRPLIGVTAANLVILGQNVGA